jgi:tRNA A-37 threonylcarbamoyl transferase component Bud32
VAATAALWCEGTRVTGFGDRIRPLQPQDPKEVSGYWLHGRIGAGGMGTVYLSETRGGQPVALKVVHAQLAEDPLFRRRFRQEVNAARRVRGRYLVPVLDSDTEGAVPWVATEYVPGPSLALAVATHGPLPPEAVVRLIAGIAHALVDIHASRVVHRDLKPGNVMLAEDGPAVIDFGIAQAADATALTGTDVRVGTPAFMAPEQIEGSSPATQAVDVFALGLTAHFAATGAHPFGEGSASALPYRIVNGQPDLSSCPDGLRELIGRCLAKDPADRPSPSDIVEACRSLGETLGLDDPLPSTGWLPAAYPIRIDTEVDAEAPRLPPHIPPHVMSAPTPALLTQNPAGAGAGAGAADADGDRSARRNAGGTATAAITLALLCIPGLLNLMSKIPPLLDEPGAPTGLLWTNLAVGVLEIVVLAAGALLLFQRNMAGRWMIATTGGVGALHGMSASLQTAMTGADLTRGDPIWETVYVVAPLTAVSGAGAMLMALLPSTGQWCLRRR